MIWKASINRTTSESCSNGEITLNDMLNIQNLFQDKATLPIIKEEMLSSRFKSLDVELINNIISNSSIADNIIKLMDGVFIELYEAMVISNQYISATCDHILQRVLIFYSRFFVDSDQNIEPSKIISLYKKLTTLSILLSSDTGQVLNNTKSYNKHKLLGYRLNNLANYLSLLSENEFQMLYENRSDKLTINKLVEIDYKYCENEDCFKGVYEKPLDELKNQHDVRCKKGPPNLGRINAGKDVTKHIEDIFKMAGWFRDRIEEDPSQKESLLWSFQNSKDQLFLLEKIEMELSSNILSS